LPFIEAQRIKDLPPYLFARIEQLIAQKQKEGVDIINLGIGDPDQPTPEHIVQALINEAQNPVNHQYPTSSGLLAYRQAVADWYEDRFGVKLNPQTEIVSLIGSKEGIAHISWCYLDPGDVVLVPDPAYPVYAGGAVLAGAGPYYLPLKEERGYLPDLAAIPVGVAKKAKLMFLNYPNNPTGAVAPRSFFQEVVVFAREFNLLVCHDAPYTEIAYDGYRPLSFLEIPYAKEIGLEFHSLSKTFCMTGWRIGWAAGNAAAVEALGRLKTNIDSGQFQAIQCAAIAALKGTDHAITQVNKLYQERRDILVDGFNSLGWRLKKPLASIYVWARVPSGHTSESFAELVLNKAGVVVTPGTGYGAYGEGYFRMSLTVSTERLTEAIRRIKENIGPVNF
jgi:LL-diaminopimelate aminotransferase